MNPPATPLEARVADECDYANSPPEKSRAYDVWLIGRKANAQGSQRTTLYVPEYRTIPGGALYVINAGIPVVLAFVPVGLRVRGIVCIFSQP